MKNLQTLVSSWVFKMCYDHEQVDIQDFLEELMKRRQEEADLFYQIYGVERHRVVPDFQPIRSILQTGQQ